MPISPWTKGQLLPVWSDTTVQDAPVTGGASQPLNLTGCTAIRLHMQSVDANNNPVGGDVVGSGVTTITGILTGQFTYAPNAADTFVSTVGTVSCQWEYVYATGSIWSDPFTIITRAQD